MDNNSNTLLGWEAVADALSSETLNNPLVTGTFSTSNDDLSDDESNVYKELTEVLQ